MTTVYNDDACIRSLGSGDGGGSLEPPVVLTYTETHQVLLEDLEVTGNVVEMTSSEAIEVIVPLDATLLFTPANQAMFVAGGTGDVTFVGETPEVIINSKEGMLTLNGQYAGARLYKRNEPNEWGLVGDLKAGAVPTFRMLAPDAETSSFTVAVEMSSGSATIDWGDGSEPTITTGGTYTFLTITDDITHDYSGFVGAAEINISGDIKRIQVVGSGITEVLEWASYEQYLLNLADLTSVPEALPTSITSLDGMFSGAESFNQLITFDGITPTSASGTFANAKLFNQVLDFDASQITSLSFFLFGALAYNQPINLATPLLTDVSGMLRGSTAFNQEVNIDTGLATNLDSFLYGATSYNQPITLDLSSADSLIGFLFNATSFNQEWVVDAPIATSLRSLLSQASALNSPITINAANATDLQELLSFATSFNAELVLNTPLVDNMTAMLRGATSFDQDLSGTCVTYVVSEPTQFAVDGCPITAPHKPVWGTCPA